MKRFYTYIGTATFIIFLISTGIADAAIIVVSTRGRVAYKIGRVWNPLVKGARLAEGTMISTGVNSRAIISLDGHILTVRPMSMIKVYSNRIRKGISQNKIGLRYGRINARIKRIGKLRTSFKISTPVATSSVRGTEQDVWYGPGFGMWVFVPVNEAALYGRNGLLSYISGKSFFNLRPGQPRPHPLLWWAKGRRLVWIFPKNITDDEKRGHFLFWDDFLNNNENPIDFIDGKTRMTPVTVELIWP